jgi:hypothetical protein
VSERSAGQLEEVQVTGSALASTGLADAEAASVGTVLAAQIAHRPALRPAELLETIPGMVVTQHSGDGKANQYFLRGFNLDHGSDFANYVDGMPINMVSHGHGQGYTDLNFLIPELVDRIVYRKGPYYAEAGDFSSAGTARTSYARAMANQTVKLTVGENDYARLLAFGGVAAADGQLVYALESQQNDGPWQVPEGFDKANGVLKYSGGDPKQGYSLTAMAYEADWTSTDQIPQRLVAEGSVDRYGSLDDSTGGDTHRYSLSAEIWSGVGFSQRGLIYDLFASAAVEEQALGVYSSVHSQWTAWFASIAGLRYQTIDVVVADKLDATAGGRDREALLSPKLSLRFGPFASTEFFINYGEGFHSNDARGVVRKASAVPLMSESVGYELGMRSLLANDIQLSVVAFRLDLDSELVFVGDESTTEPRDASRRQGLEVSVFYQPMDWFVLDMDFASSETEFKQLQVDEGQVLGKYVPDSVEQVFAMGASIDLDNGVYAGLRLRYFGPRKLTEGGDVESAASKSLNANIGYRFSNGISLGLEVINALDERDDDITYYYASRTLSERSASIEPQLDMHAHPMEPRTYRGTLAYHF